MEREFPGKQFEPSRSRAARRGFQAGVLALAGIVGLVVIACWKVPEDDAASPKESGWRASSSTKNWDNLFGKWTKPDLALLLSAQQLGYLQPCGCSKPQYGGLTRRFNFLELLKGHGWPVVAMDLGDIPQAKGIQRVLKFATSMKALEAMKYAAVGIGGQEMNMPLIEALAQHTLNNPIPNVLASNLLDKEKGRTFDGMVKSQIVGPKDSRVKVGIIGVVGPSVRKLVRDSDVKLDDTSKVLPQALRQVLALKANVTVLLYQGSLVEAKACARAFPYFDVIVCLSSEEEPPSVPDPVITKNKTTLVVTLGHKGRYVGVMGVYATGKAEKPYDFRYQLVALGEEFETPKGKENDHKIMQMMEEYAREVKRNNYLGQAAMRKELHPVQRLFPKSTYVGSEKCKKCHGSEYETWEKSPHSWAYKTLVDARNPSLRQYDSECIECHVTGWNYKTGFMNEKDTPFLKDNGCENCHGPCSEHIHLLNDKKAQKKIRDLINPYRFNPEETPVHRARRLNLIDQNCQKCHDIENDVKWDFDKKWWKIVHSDDAKKPANPKDARGR